MIHVVMPQMGESIAEGTIVKWLKAAGDTVARDEPLFEITTDKVDAEVPAPAAGTLSDILVKEGETVDVGTTVATIATAESREAVQTTQGKLEQPPEQPAEERGGHFRASQPSQVVSFRRGPDTRGVAASKGSTRSLSPAVLDAVRRGGMSIGTVTGLQGSGRGGRVTKRDVEQYLRQHGPGSAPESTASASTVTPGGDLGHMPDEYVYRPKPGDERVHMTPVRRKIAHHMSWSTKISPHATAIAECDMSRAAALIERAGQPFEASVGASLTYTVLVAQAAVKALGEFRSLNASVVGEEIVLKPCVNLGVAVALPETGELIVPVIREADGLSLPGFAKAVKGLASRTRARQLKPEDVQGGTFTLTNPGIFGGLTGTPIINQPEVAILGLGAITKRPVVVDDAIAIRPIMMVSLTFDHRAADGMTAFRYLARVREHLEQLPEDLA